jgi:molybdopterin converting factor small subunit
MKVIGIPEDAVTISLVNGLRQPLDYMLKDGDRVGLFPPLGGG